MKFLTKPLFNRLDLIFIILTSILGLTGYTWQSLVILLIGVVQSARLEYQHGWRVFNYHDARKAAAAAIEATRRKRDGQ